MDQDFCAIAPGAKKTVSIARGDSRDARGFASGEAAAIAERGFCGNGFDEADAALPRQGWTKVLSEQSRHAAGTTWHHTVNEETRPDGVVDAARLEQDGGAVVDVNVFELLIAQKWPSSRGKALELLARKLS